MLIPISSAKAAIPAKTPITVSKTAGVASEAS